MFGPVDNDSFITAIAQNPDKTKFAIGNEEGQIVIWDMETDELVELSGLLIKEISRWSEKSVVIWVA